MPIAVGDKLPAVTLFEYIEPSEGCSAGPKPVAVTEATAGRTIALFGLPGVFRPVRAFIRWSAIFALSIPRPCILFCRCVGAFTPTCSAQHAPGYIEKADELKSAGVDEIWCVSVNDAFVMGAWGRDLKAGGKIRMLADGSADFAKAIGITLDLSAKGLGLRSGRFSMLIKDGELKVINVEEPGQFTVSDVNTLLTQLKAL